MPDLPGHGDSQGRGTRLGTDEDKYLVEFAAAHTAGDLLLVGHSLGATVAIHAAYGIPHARISVVPLGAR